VEFGLDQTPGANSRFFCKISWAPHRYWKTKLQFSAVETGVCKVARDPHTGEYGAINCHLSIQHMLGGLPRLKAKNWPFRSCLRAFPSRRLN